MPSFFTKSSSDKVLIWRAPSRPFRKKDRSYYTTIAILVILLILIALLMHEIMLIGVLLAVAFVAYVLGFVPPEDVDYKISEDGITVENHFYPWVNLKGFWYGQKEGQKILFLSTNLRFPSQLMLVLGEVSEEEIKKTIVKYIPFHEIAPKSLMDNWAESLQKHFPLENPHR